MPASPWTPQQLDARNRLTVVARLLSTAIHETGNALQVISGNAELLEAKSDDPIKTRDRAQKIRIHSDQAGLRLRTLAALASAQPGPAARLDMGRVADRALDFRRYSLTRAQIASSVTGAGEVMADEYDLIRLIANLILNAEHAVCDRPNPVIHLAVSTSPEWVSLTISDNGPGVADALRAHQFSIRSLPEGTRAAAWPWRDGSLVSTLERLS